MKNLTSAQVRQMFLDFFKEKKHDIEPSASLIPSDDPTLLWINSGVATLKKYFDGRVVPENPRIANAQKAIRTNDIENVGKTARHHTFFEMLGNFSIGDYFKRDAIRWAWMFLTAPEWIGFDPDRLSVTIHRGDDEAFSIWHEEIGLSKERIIRLEGNFWDIGEGPSGPNSEIFYDRGPGFGDDPNDPELFPGGDNDRYLEIWNLVFSQFNHQPDGSYTPLPKKNIDTGMGLERMVSVIQHTKTNFETDLFMPIIEKIASITGRRYGEDEEVDTVFKVAADHVRTVAFAISDGALPSNEGRGYILRRLIRRAIRFAKSIGLNDPYLYRLVPVVGNIMVDFYPEVREKTPFIQKVVQREEERFFETIHEGLSILSEMVDQVKKNGRSVLLGEDVFKLYDTYGFPIELTEEYVKDEHLQIDRNGFQKALEAQQERARFARKDEESMRIQGGILADILEESQFVGYWEFETSSIVKVIVQDGEVVDFVSEGGTAQVILDRTPFYAESGGQVADHGEMIGKDVVSVVKDVKKAPNQQHLHTIKVEKGRLRTGDHVTARIHDKERVATQKNHTATHLLHQALKDVLGSHVNQAGSLVTPGRLRFDFSHFQPVEASELKEIEGIVNDKIWDNLRVDVMKKPLAEAKAMGAMALFGEKYGDIVRVVKVGDYSLELCGGCHVQGTANIGLFKITLETGIGTGTRRIEAVTGRTAFSFMSEREHLLEKVAGQLHTNIHDIPKRMAALQERLRELEHSNESLAARVVNMETMNLQDQAEIVNGVTILAKRIHIQEMDRMRMMADELKKKLGSAIVVLGAAANGKVHFVAGVTQDLTKRGFHAGKLVKTVAAHCEGGGGGRPDMAQAGGKNPDKLDEALRSVTLWVKSKSE